MKNIIPRVKLKPQSLTTKPFTPDSTLVDDTVALVDDTSALSGGNTTIIPSIRAKAKIPLIRTAIKRRR